MQNGIRLLKPSMAKTGSLSFSLEVFPPKTEGGGAVFWKNLQDLQAFSPIYISVTSTARPEFLLKTADLALAIQSKIHVPAAAHFTLIGQDENSIQALAKDYWQKGIRHIVALRGDWPADIPRNNHLQYAEQLVKILKKVADFEISVAGYPEKHPEAKNETEDLQHLQAKVDAGADRVITQFFFDPEVFLRFRDRAQKIGITVPIVPGILPILNFPKLLNFAARCQASVPDFLKDMFLDVQPETHDHQLLAMNVLSHQITRLVDEGVSQFHFYTLNESLLTRHVCRWMRLAF